MKLLRILLIFITPIAIGGAMLFSLFNPTYYFYTLVGSFALQDIMLFFLFPRQERKWDVISMTFPIVFHMLLAWGTLFYIEDTHILYTVIIVSCVLQYVFLWNSYYFLYKFERYQKRALPHITSYIGIVNVFYAATIVYAMGFYQDISIWYTVGPLLLFLGLTTIQNAWINDISLREKWYYIVAVLLVMAELILTTSLLPSVYFVNALTVTLCYYMAVHLGIAALQKELTRKEIIRNSAIVLFVILLVLITTRWR